VVDKAAPLLEIAVFSLPFPGTMEEVEPVLARKAKNLLTS
jgi:hypothetical protein